MFISHYNGHELSQLDHCLLWITLTTTLVYSTVDSGLTITSYVPTVLLLQLHKLKASFVTLHLQWLVLIHLIPFIHNTLS